MSIKNICCDVEGCNNDSTWWTCFQCNSKTCRGHQAFNGRIVPFCMLCYKDWLAKKKVEYSITKFERYVNRNLCHIGVLLFNTVEEEIIK